MDVKYRYVVIMTGEKLSSIKVAKSDCIYCPGGFSSRMGGEGAMDGQGQGRIF